MDPNFPLSHPPKSPLSSDTDLSNAQGKKVEKNLAEKIQPSPAKEQELAKSPRKILSPPEEPVKKVSLLIQCFEKPVFAKVVSGKTPPPRIPFSHKAEREIAVAHMQTAILNDKDAYLDIYHYYDRGFNFSLEDEKGKQSLLELTLSLKNYALAMTLISLGAELRPSSFLREICQQIIQNDDEDGISFLKALDFDFTQPLYEKGESFIELALENKASKKIFKKIFKGKKSEQELLCKALKKASLKEDIETLFHGSALLSDKTPSLIAFALSKDRKEMALLTALLQGDQKALRELGPQVPKSMYDGVVKWMIENDKSSLLKHWKEAGIKLEDFDHSFMIRAISSGSLSVVRELRNLGTSWPKAKDFSNAICTAVLHGN